MDTSVFLPPAIIAALASFTLLTSITPGPNNIMLATSGVNFGIRRTIPHMAGITTGVVLIYIACGLGLGVVFTHYPLARQVMEICGILYTLWLAWKIATAGSLGGGDLPHPMLYGASLAFQWVNPKLWLMAVTIVALYVRPGHAAADTAVVTGVVTALNIPIMLIWCGFGAALRDFLKIPARIRAFNIVMGGLLALSVLALLRI